MDKSARKKQELKQTAIVALVLALIAFGIMVLITPN